MSQALLAIERYSFLWKRLLTKEKANKHQVSISKLLDML
jgi:hypothetical protein